MPGTITNMWLASVGARPQKLRSAARGVQPRRHLGVRRRWRDDVRRGPGGAQTQRGRFHRPLLARSAQRPRRSRSARRVASHGGAQARDPDATRADRPRWPGVRRRRRAGAARGARRTPSPRAHPRSDRPRWARGAGSRRWPSGAPPRVTASRRERSLFSPAHFFRSRAAFRASRRDTRRRTWTRSRSTSRGFMGARPPRRRSTRNRGGRGRR